MRPLMKVVMRLPPPRRSTRRGFLKRGLFGGALLALGGVGFLATRDGMDLPLPKGGLKIFTPREYATVFALAEAMIPPRPNFPPSDSVRVAFHADRALVRADPTMVAELKQLLCLFDNALTGLLFSGGTRPFSRLPRLERTEVLEDWSTSRWTLRRSGYQALRTLVLASYYGQAEAWPSVGYPGPPSGFHDPAAPAWKGGDSPRPQRAEGSP